MNNLGQDLIENESFMAVFRDDIIANDRIFE